MEGVISEGDYDEGNKLSEVHQESEEAGCYGLVGGWAQSLRTGKRFHADTALHSDGPFFCSSCSANAVLRKCTEKVHHFAHTAPLSPTVAPGQTELHRSCLKEICDALASRHPLGNWAVERRMEKNTRWGTEQLVPDISGRIGKQPVVIEAQVSVLTLPKILKRSLNYQKWGIPILWLVPLTQELGNELFRPRLYERYFHSMYFGRTYYWLPGFGASVLPVHYGPASRYIPTSEWFDVDAKEARSEGGYHKTYRVVKSPVQGSKIDIAGLCSKVERASFTPQNERKAVPRLFLWKDNLKDWWDKAEEDELYSGRRYGPPFREPTPAV